MPPGPPPKRESERRRRNKSDIPTETVDIAALTQQPVEIPVANEDWHPVARMIWDSLPRSGQARFYEPSDWASAYLMVESISRDLEEQVVGVTESAGAVYATIPMKGASLSAYIKMMGNLLITEADRRKARVEVERANAEAAAKGPGTVTSITQTRSQRFQRTS